MADDEPLDAHVLRSVMRYFEEHAGAADTIYGIVQWRLAEERTRNEVEATARVLRHLVRTGMLMEEVRPGMSPRYRAAAAANDADLAPVRDRTTKGER